MTDTYTTTERTPTYDALRHQRLACELGIVSATRCLEDDWLASHHHVYHRLIATYRARIAEIDQKLPRMPVYAGGRKADLKALMIGYKADQVTPREFGLWMQRLMRGAQ